MSIKFWEEQNKLVEDFFDQACPYTGMTYAQYVQERDIPPEVIERWVNWTPN